MGKTQSEKLNHKVKQKQTLSNWTMDDFSSGDIQSKTKVFYPTNFLPSETDVIVGKGMKCYHHAGNKMLRRIIASRMHEYAAAACKKEKSNVLSSIVQQVRTNGAFVKRDVETGLWFVADDFLARDKVSKAIRSCLNNTSKIESKDKRF